MFKPSNCWVFFILVMIKLYATYGGIKDLAKSNSKFPILQLYWLDIRDDSGKLINNIIYSNKSNILDKMNLKIGNRYIIYCKNLENNKIINPKSIKLTNKNMRCDIIRKAFGDYTFIRGKYKGKWLSKLNKTDLDQVTKYLLWLAKRTDNEATVINTLNMLEIINR